MKLSVVIVNYNVRYFLEQCLYSVRKAVKNIPAEVFVVDNNSVDGSCAMVKEKFPEVILIENKNNLGFSKANNQAVRISKGEFVLLLNPDTVVEEDSFEKTLAFMDKTPDAGGLGVKMIDGKGNFLPESKRGLPTPIVAFYKIFGLSALFPKSKKFGKYHLGYLDKEQIHSVDVLAGCFMLLRKKTLDEVGLLDEAFFMYGEDIDLSYRITKGGYKNYYFPETTIIHYKGESTKKGSINYVRVFYNAMIIFAKKHFTKKNANLFSFLINMAVYFRASLALFARFVKSAFLPVLDALLIFLGYFIITPFYEFNKFGESGVYPKEYLGIVVPSYILVWLISTFYSGGYDKPVKITRLLRGIIIGTFIILAGYALLNEEYRFSRAMILLGSAWTVATVILSRLGLHFLGFESFKLSSNRKKKIVLLGNPDEARRVASLIKKTGFSPKIVGFVSPDKEISDKAYLGTINQLDEIIRINSIDEIVFCARDLSSQIIIQNMLNLNNFNIDYKIASPDSISVIGSNSIHTSGDLYTLEINSIGSDKNRRNKRVLDISIAFALIFSYPISLFFVKKPFGLLRNIFSILFGLKTWVGYYIDKNTTVFNLPKIRKSVLTPSSISKKDRNDIAFLERINVIYARDYKVINDLAIIWKGFSNLGN
ncbi:MAG: glycosyltransferase [Bacteroidales bacterium]|nr:glycosyltransferase [Bacteroidales bacterium]